MRPDVSVIMPAYRAEQTIARAVESVFAQEGVSVELVLCADDDVDYAALLASRLEPGSRLTVCRTPEPRSGPSKARNIALDHAEADVIGCLDADDAFVPDRLRRLLPLAVEHGVATGPTREVNPRTGTTRTARPRQAGAWLPVEDICELRMPFSPVYQRRLCPGGWPLIDFAEDVILNVDLYCAAGRYPFVDEASYIYHLGEGSRTESPQALEQARAGYLQILDLARKRGWPQSVRDLVCRVFGEDLAAVERALSASAASGAWREAMRDTRAD